MIFNSLEIELNKLYKPVLRFNNNFVKKYIPLKVVEWIVFVFDINYFELKIQIFYQWNYLLSILFFGVLKSVFERVINPTMPSVHKKVKHGLKIL